MQWWQHKWPFRVTSDSKETQTKKVATIYQHKVGFTYTSVVFGSPWRIDSIDKTRRKESPHCEVSETCPFPKQVYFLSTVSSVWVASGNIFPATPSSAIFTWQPVAWPCLLVLLIISLYWIRYQRARLFSHACYLVLLIP